MVYTDKIDNLKKINVVRQALPIKSTVAFFAIIVLTFIELLFDYLFILGILYDWDEKIVALYLAMAFFVIGLILTFYLLIGVPDVTILKKKSSEYRTRLLARVRSKGGNV